MRILTPIEQRQIELLKGFAVKQEGEFQFSDRDGDKIYWDLSNENDRDFWFNLLSLALAQNETLQKEWERK